jgi:predicted ATPase/serine/threonine protein kinase
MARYCPLCDQRMEDAECPQDGVPTVDPEAAKPQDEPLSPGTIVADRYQVERLIGEGAMGVVFLATRVGMLSRVALKVLKRDLTVSRSTLKRFYQEARAVSALDHPNIVRLIDFGLDPKSGLPFLAMDFVEGPTLRDLVLAYGRMPERRAAALLAQVAKALVEAHQKSIIHRDLKPANIVISVLADGDEHVKVLDFGVAKVIDESAMKEGARVTMPGTALGTPLYMSPEQAVGDAVDFRSDLYSLGCILHELLTGEPPFTAEGFRDVLKKQLTEPPPTLPGRLADGDAPTRDLLALHAALLSKRSEERPSSTAVVAWILGALSRGEQIGAETLLRRSARPGETSIEDAPPEPQVAPRETTGEEPEAPGRKSVPPTAKTNLSPELTTFVGREKSLEDLDRLFESGARFVTIFGTGGTGKTRLAKKYGSLSVHEYSKAGGGVWFADLTEAKDLEGVLAAAAEALDAPLVGARGSDSVTHLGHVMRERGKILLILDNFEHVAKEAASTVARWLEIAPEARFLVTSRELLLIEGETHLQLAPLDLEEGIELFETRARAARPTFHLSGAEKKEVEEIVRRLDGIPLAIELAAARIGVLSLEQLTERLSTSFQVLTASTRSLTHRHRTMRNAIDWSWNLLAPHEQGALAQMAVFAGGFSLEAAEAVIDLSRWDDAPMVLDVVQSLAHKSLVHAGEAAGFPGEIRFGLFGSIREYLEDKLDRLGVRADAEMRHTAYYLRESEKWSAGAGGSRALKYLRLLRLELDNISAMMARAERSDPESAVRGALALEPMLSMRGPLEAAIRIFDRAVEWADRAPNKRLLVRALLCRESARTEAGVAKPAEVQADIERALSVASSLKAFELEGEALVAQAKFYLEVAGRMSDARAAYERALKLFRDTKHRLLEGRTLVRLGYTFMEQGNDADARKALEEGLEIARVLDDCRYEGYALTTIATLEHKCGQLGEARSKYERGVAIHRSVGNRRNEGMDTAYLGFLQYELGVHEEARRTLEESVRISRDVGHRKWEAFALAITGAIHADSGAIDAAVKTFERANELMKSVNDVEQQVAMDVLAGILEVALARSHPPGDPARKTNLEAARARLSRAAGMPPAIAGGSDVLIASRILAKRVDAFERTGP